MLILFSNFGPNLYNYIRKKHTAHRKFQRKNAQRRDIHGSTPPNLAR